MDWHVREATSADRDFLLEVHRQALGPYVEQTWGWDDAEQRAHFDKDIDEGGWSVIVAGGSDVGIMRTSETGEHVYLDDIEILPQFQRKGLGTSVIGAVIAGAERNRKSTSLQVLRVDPAWRLYQKLGFEVVGEDQIHIRMKRQSDSRIPREVGGAGQGDQSLRGESGIRSSLPPVTLGIK